MRYYRIGIVGTNKLGTDSRMCGYVWHGIRRMNRRIMSNLLVPEQTRYLSSCLLSLLTKACRAKTLSLWPNLVTKKAIWIGRVACSGSPVYSTDISLLIPLFWSKTYIVLSTRSYGPVKLPACTLSASFLILNIDNRKEKKNTTLVIESPGESRYIGTEYHADRLVIITPLRT